MDEKPVRLCGAKTSSGTPCARVLGPFQTRCYFHGGATVGARREADRLQALAAAPAWEVQITVMDLWLRAPTLDHPALPSVVAAARYVLDRTGYAPALVMRHSIDQGTGFEDLSNEELAARAEALMRQLRADDGDVLDAEVQPVRERQTDEGAQD
jgi:hypothetical protein